MIRGAARLYATGGNGAIYYGLGVTEHSQGSTTVMAIANLAMVTGNIGRRGVGVNPLRGQNNVQGSCDMGSFPHELPGYRHVSDDAVRDIYESLWGVKLDNEPGLRIPNMLDAAVEGTFKGIYIQGEDILQSDPDTKHVSAGLAAMECVVVHDLFLNETANYAHVFLPGSTFLEKDGTFTNAERRINRVRKVMAPKNGLADWEVTQKLAQAMGLAWNYVHPSEIMDEIATTTPSFAKVSYDYLDQMGSVQWPCNEKSPEGTPIMHIDGFVRGKGKFIRTEYVATDEKTGPRFPLLLTTGRVLSPVQCRRADAAHRQCRLARGGRAGDPSARCREPRHPRRRLGAPAKPRRRHDAARRYHRARRAGRRLHHLPPSRHAGQRHHHRLLRLGDQLPGIQGDGGAGQPVQRSEQLAGRVRGAFPPQPAHRRQAGSSRVVLVSLAGSKRETANLPPVWTGDIANRCAKTSRTGSRLSITAVLSSPPNKRCTNSLGARLSPLSLLYNQLRSSKTSAPYVAPLCPAGHLPHKGGDWQFHACRLFCAPLCNSLFVGEMAGRPERGASL